MMRVSVLLPAPFSPTRAWTSPARRSKSTCESAWTPGKVLSMPVARKSLSVVAAIMLCDVRASFVVTP